MPRNGSGTYIRTDGVRTGATVFQQEAAAAIDIEAVNLDIEATDMGTALTASIANDGQTPILANLPMSTFKHTGVGAATAATDYLRADQGQNQSPNWGGTFGGTANALTCTLAPAISAFTAGLVIRGIAASAPTGAANLTANAVGPANIRKKLAGGLVALTGGEWATGDVLEFTSNGTVLVLSDKSEWQSSAALTSAATVDLATSTGEYVAISGSTGPITSLGTLPAGVTRVLRFASTPTLTYNAASLILPGGASITAAAGDMAVFISEGAGNWRCVAYTKASGGAIVGGMPWTTTSGSFNAATGSGYLVDTSGGTSIATLPAAPATGESVFFSDMAGTFNINALTIARNSLKIMGLAEDMTVNTQYVAFGLVYSGATNGWRFA